MPVIDSCLFINLGRGEFKRINRVIKMRAQTIIFLVFLIGFSAAGSAGADIYVWTDENGIKHITNYAPPEHAKVLMRTPEIPYDAEADRQRLEADRREQLAREKQEMAEREARLELLEREANARITAAEQYDREMRAYQQGLADQARVQEDSSRSNWYGGSVWYGGRGYYPGYHRNGYYRKDGNIYYKKRHPHRYHKKWKDHPRKKHYKRSAKVNGHYKNRSHHKSYTGRKPYPSSRSPRKGPHAYNRRY